MPPPPPSSGSAYALPARYEPFGLTVLEAALAGCTLVLGDIPSLGELWADAAVFVPPEDPEALQLALQGLIDDPVRRRARRYSAERMVRRYLDLYGRLLDSRRQEASACAS
jgi:glycogen synthase